MKILYFIDSLQVGGRERRFVELLKYLRANTETEIEVAVMSADIGYRDFLDLGVKTHFLIRSGKKDPKIFHRLYTLCGSVRPDILHAWDSMTATYAAPVAKIRGLKFINNMVADALHNLHTFHPSWVRARLTFPLSDYIVGNSRAGLAVYRAPAGRSGCIYNGFDESRVGRVLDGATVRRNLGISTPKLVGMVANFSHFKDYHTYLLAAQKVLGGRDDSRSRSFLWGAVQSLNRAKRSFRSDFGIECGPRAAVGRGIDRFRPRYRCARDVFRGDLEFHSGIYGFCQAGRRHCRRRDGGDRGRR